MPVNTNVHCAPRAATPSRSVVRPNSSGAKWCTPSATPSTPAQATYTSTGCRFPADIAVRKYVRSSNAADGLVRVTPPVKNSSRASAVASSGTGAGGRPRPDSTSAARAPDSPMSRGSGIGSRPT